MARMDVREKQSSEKRLIDYDKLYLSVMDAGLSSCDEDTIFDLMDDSAVDAVEVVRCKDCKHRYSDSWCEYVDDDDNFYCARGERKEGAD